MISKLKNWWLVISGSALVILDQGFDIINPILVDIGVTGKWIGIVKILFFLYGAYKVKKQLPTQNADKLKDIFKNKFADDIGGGGIKNPPPPKEEKK